MLCCVVHLLHPPLPPQPAAAAAQKQVPGAASDLLSRVQLTGASHVRAAAYSGGMKRRLSVALALVGDPKVSVWCVGREQGLMC